MDDVFEVDKNVDELVDFENQARVDGAFEVDKNVDELVEFEMLEGEIERETSFEKARRFFENANVSFLHPPLKQNKRQFGWKCLSNISKFQKFGVSKYLVQIFQTFFNWENFAIQIKLIFGIEQILWFKDCELI